MARFPFGSFIRNSSGVLSVFLHVQRPSAGEKSESVIAGDARYTRRRQWTRSSLSPWFPADSVPFIWLSYFSHKVGNLRADVSRRARESSSHSMRSLEKPRFFMLFLTPRGADVLNRRGSCWILVCKLYIKRIFPTSWLKILFFFLIITRIY